MVYYFPHSHPSESKQILGAVFIIRFNSKFNLKTQFTAIFPGNDNGNDGFLEKRSKKQLLALHCQSYYYRSYFERNHPLTCVKN